MLQEYVGAARMISSVKGKADEIAILLF